MAKLSSSRKPTPWPLGVQGMGKVGLSGGGGGGIRAPQRREGGSLGKGDLVTSQSQEASLKPLMMTHQLRRKAARKIFFQKISR